jgi:hypothetical protein
MHLSRLAFAFALVLVGCDSDSSTTKVDAAVPPDAAAGALCTGAVYDPCVSSDQCTSQNCRLYNGSALQICTQVCSAAIPCPNDASGAAVACNQMGNCKPAVANNCHR